MSHDGRPVVYLVGTSGHPNFGDELIAAGWLRYLARTAPHAEVWLDSPRPGRSEVLLGGLHPNLRCVDTLYHACWNAPTDSAAATLDYGRRVISDPGLIPREATGVEDLSRVDLVHIIGGGYINAIWPSHLALFGAAQGMAEQYDARTASTGAGLTPYVEGSVKGLGEILSSFDIVDVRDEASLQALVPLVQHATNSRDDAFLTVEAKPQSHDAARETMLCLQSDLSEISLEQLAQYVVRTLQSWEVDQDTITLVECLPPDDSAIVHHLSPDLPGLTVTTFAELWREGFPARSNQRWISTRFHPHLLAAAAGNWGVAIPISKDYYQTKHEALTKLGSGWSIAGDLNDPIPPGSVSTPFGGNLSSIVDGKRQVATALAGLIP